MFCLRTVGDNKGSQGDVNRQLRDENGDVCRVSSICRVDLEELGCGRIESKKGREKKRKLSTKSTKESATEMEGRLRQDRDGWGLVGYQKSPSHGRCQEESRREIWA